MSKSKESLAAKSAQQDVQGENLNDFVASLSAGGKLKQHAEHDNVRSLERQVNKFTKFTEKNRFTNAILFTQGSIDLVPEEKTDTTYIHASKINCPGGAVILAQAPMKSTLVDFYRLIWQQKVSTIVCVVNLDDKEQCHPYFERKAGKKTTQRNRFRVRTVAVRNEGKNIVNYELKIENYLEKKENKSRGLNVISILGWEPDAIYDVKTVISAIHSAEALKRIGPQLDGGKDAPMLIHGCSGIRRTGVFALSYIFSKQIIGQREINLLGIIEQVRMVRYGVIRQKKMFFFLLEIIVALITETGQLQPGSDDHVHVVQMIKKMYVMADRKKKSKKDGPKTEGGKSEKSEAAKTGGDDDEDEDGDDDEPRSQTGTGTGGTTGKSGKSGKSTPRSKGSKEGRSKGRGRK